MADTRAFHEPAGPGGDACVGRQTGRHQEVLFETAMKRDAESYT
jgi:hypothetical protein